MAYLLAGQARLGPREATPVVMRAQISRDEELSHGDERAG
ncbi:hypothetical protein ACVWXN_006958 [Bradyrhizobium sp. i1.4.4]